MFDVSRQCSADIIEVSFLPANVMKYLKRIGFQKMLEGGIMLHVGEKSPIRNHTGWDDEKIESKTSLF